MSRFLSVCWVLVSLLAGLLLAVLFVSAAAAHGPSQTAGSPFAAISDLDLSQFPKISGQLRAYHPDGSFVDNLDASQVTILEGPQPLPLDALTLERPGVQFVLAILGGSDLAFKDAEGSSSLDYLLEGAAQWVGARSEGEADDLSLIVQGSTEMLHQRDPVRWLDALRNIDEDSLRQVEPDLQILNRALTVAEGATPSANMGKALLLITPAVRTGGVTGVQSLASTARQSGVRVYIWLVSSQEYGSSILTNGLRLLAAETGGAFFNYTGVETIPPVQNYLDPLRQIYAFSYISAIRSSGVFTMSAQIETETFSQRTAPLEFALSITAPNPIFVNLPVEITRQVAADRAATPLAGALPDFEPVSHPVHILVEFPDGNQREITESTLIVDGIPVAVNQSPPFDEFLWDLSAYTANSQVTVKVEVVDALGLIGSSAEFPIAITVISPPPPSPTAIILTPQGALALLLTAVALGAVVGLGLLVSGRLRLYRHPVVNQGRSVKRATNGAATLPLSDASSAKASRGASTRPLASARSATSSLPGWMGRIQRRMQPAKAGAPVAYLTPITEGEDSTAPPLPINTDESILGSEITWTTWAIKDPSLSPVHARLVREGEGFRLFDEKTTSGTWVNFTPVPPQGALLSHGDAVHFGRVGFRFTLRGGSPSKPIITPLKKKYPF